MPIADLLASISGEGSKPSAASTSKAKSPQPKRKAEDDISGRTAKAPRSDPATASAPKPNEAAAGNKPSTTSSPSVSSVRKPAPPARPNGRPSGAPPASRLGNTPSRPLSGASAQSGGKAIPARIATNRPAPPASTTSPAPTATPKKGSFQEIMARAQAAQAALGPVGKIQHKPIQRGMTMKERKEMKAEQSRVAKKGAKSGLGAVRSSSNGPSRNGSPGVALQGKNGTGKPSARPADGTKPVNGKGRNAAPVEEVKKVKKAALANLGYTGAARPRPGADLARSGPAATKQRADPGSGEHSRHQGPPAGRRRYDDYDEELDDFIEYDDEEDEPGYGYGGRGGYSDEEDESDMEAGMSDIDEEERVAESAARREDQMEQALIDRKKREKDERKQLWEKRRERMGAR